MPKTLFLASRLPQHEWSLDDNYFFSGRGGAIAYEFIAPWLAKINISILNSIFNSEGRTACASRQQASIGIIVAAHPHVIAQGDNR